MDLAQYLRTRFPTQDEAAKAFNVSQGTISHWITGRRLPKPAKASEIIEHSQGALNFETIYGARPQ